MKWETKPLAEIADFSLGKMLDEKKNSSGSVEPAGQDVRVVTHKESM
jgi:hypothetical protein